MMPFFTYFGGKWRGAKHYPEPKHSHIIEPFAGSAVEPCSACGGRGYKALEGET